MREALRIHTLEPGEQLAIGDSKFAVGIATGELSIKKAAHLTNLARVAQNLYLKCQAFLRIGRMQRRYGNPADLVVQRSRLANAGFGNASLFEEFPVKTGKVRKIFELKVERLEETPRISAETFVKLKRVKNCTRSQCGQRSFLDNSRLARTRRHQVISKTN